MKITIKINGKDKEFKTDFISARMFRRSEELSRKHQNKEEVDIDEIVDFIVQVFNNKFTIDEFYDGVDVSDIFPIFLDTNKKIMEKFKSKIAMFPNE